MSAGRRSQVSTSWLPVSCSALKVWKNSSSVLALRCRNWTSSISRTSVRRKRILKSSMSRVCSASTNSFVKRSAVVQRTRSPPPWALM